MRFRHEGQIVTHSRLHQVLLRGVRFSDQEGVFVVQVGTYRGQIEVEDTPFWVVAYDAESGEIQLTDGSSEQLEVQTLSVDPDEVLRCRVKQRFPARFTHAGQAHLLDALELRDGTPGLRVGDRWVELGKLASLA